MKIWTVTYNDDNGSPSSTVHLSKEDAEENASEWVICYADPYPEAFLPSEDWRQTFERLCEIPGFIDSVSIEEHELDDSATWHALKAANPGSFGVLYDPAEILTMMDGWGEEYDFDPDTPEDVEAITAWCEEEAAGFEDCLSTLVGDNAPTVADAYGALDRKRAKISA